jgi:hypothetical protein
MSFPQPHSDLLTVLVQSWQLTTISAEYDITEELGIRLLWCNFVDLCVVSNLLYYYKFFFFHCHALFCSPPSSYMLLYKTNTWKRNAVTCSYFIIYSAGELEQRETEFARHHYIHFTFPKAVTVTLVHLLTLLTLCKLVFQGRRLYFPYLLVTSYTWVFESYATLYSTFMYLVHMALW